jgi:hypothetical protein
MFQRFLALAGGKRRASRQGFALSRFSKKGQKKATLRWLFLSALNDQFRADFLPSL